MTEVYAIVECNVIFQDGSKEIRRPTFAEVSIGLASVDKVSVVNYLKENLTNVQHIEVLDTLYFRNKAEYEKYLSSL
jgi:hypothetical protein